MGVDVYFDVYFISFDVYSLCNPEQYLTSLNLSF